MNKYSPYSEYCKHKKINFILMKKEKNQEYKIDLN